MVLISLFKGVWGHKTNLKYQALFSGTDQERGLTEWRHESAIGRGGKEEGETSTDTYSLSLINTCINRLPAMGRLPFCPPASTRTRLEASRRDQEAEMREVIIRTANAKNGKVTVDSGLCASEELHG